MDRFETMRAFVSVAQEGSFTGAGKRLGVSTKLVSKYVAHLEARMSVQLFNRTTRKVSLTDIGAAYLNQCITILDQIDDIEARLQDQHKSISGRIKMTAPTAFGSAKLIECLLPYQQEHPAVEVDLVLSDTRIALVEEGYDLAIRVGRLRDGSLIAKKLSDMPMVLCASPDYLKKHGEPRHPSALATHLCLLNGNQLDVDTWTFRDKTSDVAVNVSGPFKANAPRAVAMMAEGGLGIALCPQYVVEQSVAEGKLIPLLTEYPMESMGVYALYPPSRHLTARVRTLIDMIALQLKKKQ
jgi:DNA-binding transcriptional LysR family regulator